MARVGKLLVLFLLAACEPQTEQAAASDPDPDLANLLGGDVPDGFRKAEGQREFRFPADHAAHPGYRNEWWYLTGNLDGNNGRRFGYELTFFRFALLPANGAERASAWDTRHVWIGHFAITDVSAKRFHFTERVARGAVGLAGAGSAPVRIWLYDWQLRRRTSVDQAPAWQLQARDGDMRIDLALEAVKPPVLHGVAGLSRKSAEAGNASWYYSMPRLRTTGILELDGQRHSVSGLSWLDREWSSSALSPEQAGWDWFALQLDDGSDLMFYNLRRRDGSRDTWSAGTWINADGSSRPLARDEVEIEVLDHWESPAGGRYPHGWRLRIPSQRVDLRIRPLLADQELRTWVRYWEGAVDVTGTHGAKRLGGRGYVELTGYAGSALRRP